MKYITVIDINTEERVEIYSKERTELVNKIESLIDNDSLVIIGKKDNENYLIDINEVERIFLENNKTYVSIKNEHYQIKYRLYQLEEKLGNDFIKINQSCLANKQYISKFESSWGGSLLIVFKNKEKDYVSRRQVKYVKERLGVK